MFDPSPFLFSSPSVDLYDDFPPLSRAGLPDGMMVEGKKARRPARKRGDSVHLKVRCLAEAEEGGSDQETREAERDGGQSEAEDRAVFQFFSDEVRQHRKERRRKFIFLSFLHLFFALIQKLESTDEEPSASKKQLRDDLNKLLQGDHSSQGVLTWPPEKKPPRKGLQPEAASSSSSPGASTYASASACLEARGSSQLCPGDQTARSSLAAAAGPRKEAEAEALGSSVEEEYITVQELQGELSRLLQENHSSQEIIRWLQVGFPSLLRIRIRLQYTHTHTLTPTLLPPPTFSRLPSTTTTPPRTTSWRS